MFYQNNTFDPVTENSYNEREILLSIEATIVFSITIAVQRRASWAIPIAFCVGVECRKCFYVFFAG